MQGSHPSFGQNAAPLAKSQQASERWATMAEKCAFRVLQKDMFAKLSKIQDCFERKLI